MSTYRKIGWSAGWCRRLGRFGVLVTAVVAACCVKQTPAPPAAITNPTDPNQRELVIAYGDSLTFLVDAVVRGSSDKQPLDIVVNDTVQMSGCVGQIMAEENAHKNDFDRLRGDITSGSGVITVAFEIDAAQGHTCVGYQAGNLELRPGRSYVWVGDLGDSSFVENGQEYVMARALVIPVNTEFDASGPVDIKVCVHPDYSFNHSQANWRFDPDDADAWWTCAKHGCCNGS
jgi:hypothetical protein